MTSIRIQLRLSPKRKPGEVTMKKTILLIDDDPDLVHIIKSVLIGAGYEVVTASNGLEGLEQLKSVIPHVIVLDMNMPKMGGISFYHAIANSYDGSPKYPVLVLTARANLEQLFKDFNVDGFMTKPFEIDHLLNEIDVIISKRYSTSPKPSSVEKPAGTPQKLKKVLIVNDDTPSFDKMVIAFVNAGYVVVSSKTGTGVIEKAVMEPPDIILLKLGLPDLPGDIVASKLKQMAKTTDIPLLLFTPENKDLNYDVIKQICQKIGIRDLIETDDPAVLMKESERLLLKNNG